ncbi:MAG: hypothetical protein EOQ39_03570 [Mesorhizobium sp.]|uniref:tape measure protein n=1 Tax=Mesorhizobium sp. TaxID=1871066 RepID=UPI000FE6B794|nr:tape measure protein [Mesorhizobium sp.]RWB08989.1 MAG: hypothetical protein EOQ37_05725 [Mesorhizobium sp.]RWB17410.1 MAG: hypothetical protein EOQ39_03570 [Mesorhizobium sp.]
MADEERLIVALEARIRDFERNMQRASQTAGKNFGDIEKRAKASADRLDVTMARASARVNANLKNIGAGFLAGFSVQGAQRLIDQATRIQNALKVAGLSGDDLTKVYDRLFESAQRNAAPLESLVQLYSRAALQQKELGVSSEQLLTFTDNVALALRVAGTDAQSASGALLQLGQALGSGTVHAEEFNSILEGAPTIAQAAAAGIKEANGSVAALKQLVIDGKLSSKAFFDGFAAGAITLQQRVSGAETTISGRFVRLQNVLVDTAGKFDANAHATEIFGRFLDELGGLIRNFGDDIAAAAPALRQVEDFLNAANDAATNLGRSIGEVTGTLKIGDALREMFAGVDTDPVAAKLAELQKTVTALQDAIKFNTEMGIDTSVVQGQLDQVLAKIAAIKSGAAVVVAPIADQSASGVAAAINEMVPFNPLAPASTPDTTKPITLTDYPVGGSGKGNAGGIKSRASTDDYAREVKQIQRRTELLRLETAAQSGVNPLIDDYGAAVEKARMKQELLNAAQDAGHKITPELEASIDALSQAYADASTDAQKLAEKQDEAKEKAKQWADLQQDVVGGFLKDLKNGTKPIDALYNAINRLADVAIDNLVKKLFEVKDAGMGGGSGGLFGGILGFVGNLFGFSTGGEVKRLAGGGHVRGPGTPTSDSIPAMLSDGEYVVNAAATAKHRPLIEAINSGRLLAFAKGGAVGDDGKAVRLYRPSNENAGQQFNMPVSVTVNANGGTPEQNADLARQTARETKEAVRAVVVEELMNQKRQGGVMSGRYR